MGDEADDVMSQLPGLGDTGPEQSPESVPSAEPEGLTGALMKTLWGCAYRQHGNKWFCVAALWETEDEAIRSVSGVGLEKKTFQVIVPA